MSRCAQGRSATNSCNNNAAVSVPPPRLEWFFMSATSESISARYAAGSGSGQVGSPARSEADCSAETSRPSFPISPAILGPRAVTHAPVSVARSTIASGASSVSEREPIGKDKAPLTVGVEDLDRLAVADRKDITRLERPASGHVLGSRGEPDDAHLDPERLASAKSRDDIGGAAHVGLHRQHALEGLKGQSPRVESDAFADEDDRQRGPVGSFEGQLGRRLVDELDQPGRLHRSGSDAEQSPKARVRDRLLIEDRRFEPGFFGNICRDLAETSGRQRTCGSLDRSTASHVAFAMTRPRSKAISAEAISSVPTMIVRVSSWSASPAW